MNNSPEAIKNDILAKLAYSIGKDRIVAKNHDWLAATILALRDRIIDPWQSATRESYQAQARRVYYISLEFLIGRLLRDALNNLDLNAAFTQALKELNVDINLAEALEPDAALGNGGLGRLAACFMESMATLDIPAYGYGIRYNHGIFQQIIKDGWQFEIPENWLEDGNPWEFSRREAAYKIAFGGHVESTPGKTNALWQPSEHLLASAFDVPMVGWKGKRVNTLRLWGARAVDPISLQAFNSGDFDGALHGSRNAEILTRVLYPSDSTPQGQELRLRQEYFATSAAIQDIMRRHVQQYKTVNNLADKVAIQINDTHPAIAVAELMRLLIDIHGMPWDMAWSTTQKVLSYTNHTLLPEALESWPVGLFERLLPRHLQIIYAINDLMLAEAHNKFNADNDFIRSVSLIDEAGGRRVRMGNLAFVGSHSINGVSALHTELMKQSVFKDLNTLYPGRINNKTNGITPRRWLHTCNPALSKLLAEVGGPETLDDAEKLPQAARIADDTALSERFAKIKRDNKAVLSDYVKTYLGVELDPSFMFDVQVKRIHEYKRQLLNILQTIDHYLAIKANPSATFVPRVKIFAGKAAPSYSQAKLIIKLANEVAKVVNADPDVNKQLKVVFLPNYNVSLAEIIVPATDLSEQISTAGMEASGTGNMKFGLNGALTIGTLDGANVEMRDHVGAENFFIFGLEAHEVDSRRAKGIDGHGVVENSPRLRAVLRELSKGTFSDGNFQQYNAIADSIYHGDWFFVGQDFDAYLAAQEEVAKAWLQPKDWTKMAIRNSVNMGWFSSDRTIREYARDIWKVPTN